MNIKESLIANILNKDIANLLKDTYNAIELEQYRDHYIVITPDTIADNPRDFDEDFKFIFFHKRYKLGDDHDYDHNNYSDWKELEKAIIKGEGGKDNVLLFPVYMQEHSGISFSDVPFNCSYDSGCIGFAVITKEIANLLVNVNDTLKYELKRYQAYVNGELIGYDLFDNQGNKIEDGYYCSGFANESEKELLEYAKRSIDEIIEFKNSKKP